MISNFVFQLWQTFVVDLSIGLNNILDDSFTLAVGLTSVLMAATFFFACTIITFNRFKRFNF